MCKKFFLSWLALFVLSMMGGFLIHGLILNDDYEKTALFRTDEESQKYFHWMLLAHVFSNGAFVWVYARGVEAKPWLPQGLRFGLVIMFLTIVPTYLIYYTVQAIPGLTVIKQIGFDGILALLMGVTVAFLWRKPAAC